MTSWFVYIVRCADDSLYTGIARDVERRIREHNWDNKLGAKYVRGRRPVTLVYKETVTTHSDACKRELAIKRLSKQHKETLIRQARDS